MSGRASGSHGWEAGALGRLAKHTMLAKVGDQVVVDEVGDVPPAVAGFGAVKVGQDRACMGRRAFARGRGQRDVRVG